MNILASLFCTLGKALGECGEEGEILKPTSTREISLAEKQSFLMVKFPGVPLFLTYQHLMASYDDIACFLAQDQTNKFGYIFPDFICSTYAMRLAGQFNVPDWSAITFGLVWTDKHALNCVLTEDMKFYFVEPQLDELQDKLEDWQGTTLRFIMI